MADMRTPSSYNYDVSVTKELVAMANAVGVLVVGESRCDGLEQLTEDSRW